MTYFVMSLLADTDQAGVQPAVMPSKIHGFAFTVNDRVMRIPTLGAAMTPFPYAVEPESTLEEARALMEDHGIRHLPVKSGDALIGVLSDRLLLRERHSSDRGLHVRDLLLGEPYSVDLATPLAEVVGKMAERRLDCAVVLKEGRVAGIFTTIDACRIFARHLRALEEPKGDDAA